ncbi:hypothetical protein BGX24_009758 [Mortierella sp. AD032]|nr:hypothetical protein BGX24_009758 [Mortierella sp. AD032]
MDDIYAFPDSALTPVLLKPFSMNYVDIWKSLKTIGRGRYKSDYRFHDCLSMVLVSLEDVNTAYTAHVGYKLDCLSSMIYVRDKCETNPSAPKSKFSSLHTSAQTPDASFVRVPGNKASAVFQERTGVSVLHIHTHATSGDIKELDNITAYLVPQRPPCPQYRYRPLGQPWRRYLICISPGPSSPSRTNLTKFYPATSVTEPIGDQTMALFNKAPGALYNASSIMIWPPSIATPTITNNLFMNASASCNKVTTYEIGGITTEPMAASSSPGGAVKSGRGWTCILV